MCVCVCVNTYIYTDQKPYSGPQGLCSNPIIAGLTVIANIQEALTWAERMKTSTVNVKGGDESGGGAGDGESE